MRFDPSGLLGTIHGRLLARQTSQPRRQLPLGFLREAAAQLGDVLQPLLPDGADQQAVKSLPRRRVAQYYARERLEGLDLPPGLTAPAGQIAAFQVLGHHAFMPLLDDLAKELLARADDPG